MSFDNRTQFKRAMASEKITIAHVDGRARVLPWTLYSGSTYVKTVSHYVVAVHNGLQNYTKADNQLSVGAGQYYYSPFDNKLYVNTGGNPADAEIIATYRFFFASAPIVLTDDLTDTGVHVKYEGRIQRSPGFKHKIGVEQNLVSIIGNGSLKLLNNDGYLDEVFETIIFDNQTISLYSWNRDLPISDRKIFYRGRITGKRYNPEYVWFEVKDELVDLKQNIPLSIFGESENVTDSIKNNYKRRLYGRITGLQLQSVDQIGEGYQITGTTSSVNGVKQVVAATSFPDGSTFTSSGEGDYFIIYTANNSTKYVYWFNVSGGNVEPALGDEYSYVEVAITAAYTPVQVRDALFTELDGNFTMIGPYVITAENLDEGRATSVQDFGTGIVWTTLVAGKNSYTISGIGTDFINEISPDDKLIIGTQEFTVENIISATELDVNSAPEYPFSGVDTFVIPEIPVRTKNRTFFVADHECARLTKTLLEVIQLNRVRLNDTVGLAVGDFVEFNTGERIEIKNIVTNNIILLRKNLIQIPTVSTDVIRQPIQNIYVAGQPVLEADYTILNSTDTRVELSEDVEFNLAKTEQFSINMTFTNGSRTITTADDVDLTEIFNPRDWIRPQDLSYSTFYEILSVDETEIIIRTNFSEPTITDLIEGKRPEYIDDHTIISANVLGKTEDGTADGEWIYTAPQAIRDLITEAGLTEINEQSFIDGKATNRQIISMALPSSPGAVSTTYKSTIDKLAVSTNSVITLDNELKVKYTEINANFPENPVVIDDFDVISWDLETVSGKNIRNSIISYNKQDINRFTQEEGFDVTTFSSDFVEKYIGTNDTEEVQIQLYEQLAAEIFSHRLVYNQSIGRTDITINTDLRLEDVEVGEIVIVNFSRMYKRFGDKASRKKAMLVYGKTLDGSRTQLELTDYGNIWNRSSIITPNDAPDWSSATEDEKLKYGYITDNQGIVNNEEDTANTHLIS